MHRLRTEHERNTNKTWYKIWTEHGWNMARPADCTPLSPPSALFSAGTPIFLAASSASSVRPANSPAGCAPVFSAVRTLDSSANVRAELALFFSFEAAECWPVVMIHHWPARRLMTILKGQSAWLLQASCARVRPSPGTLRSTFHFLSVPKSMVLASSFACLQVSTASLNGRHWSSPWLSSMPTWPDVRHSHVRQECPGIHPRTWDQNMGALQQEYVPFSHGRRRRSAGR